MCGGWRWGGSPYEKETRVAIGVGCLTKESGAG